MPACFSLTECANTEAGLAHLAAVEDVAGFSTEESGDKVFIGLTCDIGRRIRGRVPPVT